eukprot:5770636-Pleurochrysis_carterae.AAC.1
MRKKRAKIKKRAGTSLRQTCAVVMASAIARSTARVKPSSRKYFLSGSVMPFSSVISSRSPLILRLQLLDLGSHRLHGEELAVGAHLIALDFCDVLLAAEAQVRQLLPFLGGLLAAARQLVGLL